MVPADVDVSEAGIYIVRPCVNLAGMSRGAEFRHIEKETTELPLVIFGVRYLRVGI